MAFTGNEDHSITLEDASKLTKNYRDNKSDDEILGGFFGKTALLDILNQKGCVGIRYYYGQKDDGTQQTVLVGVDANEKDLVDGEIAELQRPCPPFCQEGDLNSD